MKIIPLASDSMGARSMATFVETNDVKIVIDPGVSLASRRFGLPPHPLEIKRRGEQWRKVVEFSRKAGILIISHYHYDHHRPDENLEIYRDKIVFVKHPERNINKSQRKRASYFLQKIKNLPKRIEYSDDREFVFGDTRIKFSGAVEHGTNNRLGYVTEVLIDDGNSRFIHTSDVEGPALDSQAKFILENDPEVLMVDGPMTCMLGFRYPLNALEASIKNLKEIVKKCTPRVLILEHHLLRELEWRKRVDEIVDFAESSGTHVTTSAGFLKKKDELLEARRKELYDEFPV